MISYWRKAVRQHLYNFVFWILLVRNESVASFSLLSTNLDAKLWAVISNSNCVNSWIFITGTYYAGYRVCIRNNSITQNKYLLRISLNQVLKHYLFQGESCLNHSQLCLNFLYFFKRLFHINAVHFNTFREKKFINKLTKYYIEIAILREILKENHQWLLYYLKVKSMHWLTSINKKNKFTSSSWHVNFHFLTFDWSFVCIVYFKLTKFRNIRYQHCWAHIVATENKTWQVIILSCKNKA